MSNELENINRYLQGEMTKDEREAFEALIREDDALSKELAFQKGLQGFLSRHEPEIEAKLEKLGDEYFGNQNATSKRLNYLWFLLIVLALFGIVYVLWNKENSPLPMENNNVIIHPLDSIQTEAPKEPIEKKEEISPAEEIQNIPTISQPKRPIATINQEDFLPNPLLEDLMQDKVRYLNSTDTTSISAPANDEIFPFQNKIPFKLSGSSSIKPPYQVKIFSNKSADIENDIRVFDSALTGKQEGLLFHFNLNTELTIPQGLYYLIINDSNHEILHISRFKVE